MIQNTTPPSNAITTLHQHLTQLAGGLRLPPVAAALQEAGLAHLPVGVVVAVEEAKARLEEARGAVAGLAAALQGVAGKEASAVLRCNRLELLDDDGRVRAVLGMSGAGTPRGKATADLSFYAASGDPLAHVGAWFDDEAEAELPAIQFNGPGGTDGHAIHGYADGSLSITADGRETWRIGPTGEAAAPDAGAEAGVGGGAEGQGVELPQDRGGVGGLGPDSPGMVGRLAFSL